jgi:hypothetical protein
MTEYTIHFQKGTRVGARSLRMITVTAANVPEAIALARNEFADASYRLTRVDHFDAAGRIIIDR